MSAAIVPGSRRAIAVPQVDSDTGRVSIGYVNGTVQSAGDRRVSIRLDSGEIADVLWSQVKAERPQP